MMPKPLHKPDIRSSISGPGSFTQTFFLIICWHPRTLLSREGHRVVSHSDGADNNG
jgi:hypothetical protein